MRDTPEFTPPYVKSKGLNVKEARTPPYAPGVRHFKKGQQIAPKRLSLPCDIRLEQDVSIVMRDATRLVANFYKPASVDSALPVILSFTPYGKAGGYWHLGLFPFRAGIAENAVSDLQSWEAPDPAYWCQHGYCVAYVSARGTDYSEGDHPFQGPTTATDVYDTVEWIAAQAWSNGKVGMAGNSQLAMTQWAGAALRPPHLTAIAPWEALSDHYHDNMCQGGIPFPGFHADVISHSYGNGLVEDVAAALESRPFYNDYWASKAADIRNIDIPVYLVASYTNPLHCRGTFAAYRKLKSENTWLRIHNTMEWPDFYDPDNVADLRRFFDRYLKEQQNGWESTPKVRMAVLDLGGNDIVNRPEVSWPPQKSKLKAFFLDASSASMSPTPKTQASQVSYRSDDSKGCATFEITFDQDTEISGYISLRLWVQSPDANDMDVFTVIEKVRNGRPFFRSIMPPPFKPLVSLIGFLHRHGIFKYGFTIYNGPSGRLRVSRRALNETESKDGLPVHRHTEAQLLTSRDIVPIDISILPTSMLWRAGDTLRLSVMGYEKRGRWFPDVPLPEIKNRGTHIIHTGGKFASSLMLPVMSR